MRIVETWFDVKHKKYFYTREPALLGVSVGNTATQKAFQATHKCRSFEWFMKNIASDVYTMYPPPPANTAWGQVRMRGGHLCWDTKGATAFVGLVQLDVCTEQNLNQVRSIHVHVHWILLMTNLTFLT